MAKGFTVHEGATKEAPDKFHSKASKVSREVSFAEEQEKAQWHALTCQVMDLCTQLAMFTSTF